MADTPTALGALNLWHRSTDVTTLLECPAKYALGRLFDRDAEAGYFAFGTAGHLYFHKRLTGSTPDEAWGAAVDSLASFIEGALSAGVEARWTKKRPESGAFDELRSIVGKWEADLEFIYYGEGWECVAAEFPARVDDSGVRAGDRVAVTTADSIWRRGDEWRIVDWKTGSTAKANPLQLHIYSWVLRHDPKSPIYGLPPERVGLFFHHAAFSKLQNAAPYPGDAYIEALLDWATSTKERMVSEAFAPAHPDWYCDYCLYRSGCPAWGGNLEDLRQRLASASLEREPVGEVNEGDE